MRGGVDGGPAGLPVELNEFSVPVSNPSVRATVKLHGVWVAVEDTVRLGVGVTVRVCEGVRVGVAVNGVPVGVAEGVSEIGTKLW